MRWGEPPGSRNGLHQGTVQDWRQYIEVTVKTDFLVNELQWGRSPLLLETETRKLIINKAGSPENREKIRYLIERCRHLFPARKLNTRTIRQTTIGNLLKAGKDLRPVQAFAGHKYQSVARKPKKRC